MENKIKRVFIIVLDSFGIAILCPEKRSTLAKLATRAMLGGFCVSLLSAMIVGLLMLI